jgi:hypothetical protein
VVSYSCTDDGVVWPGPGNLIAEPSFLRSNNFVDSDGDGSYDTWVLGDYHLAPSSPCIDAGTCDGAPPLDLDGNVRPTGVGCDMGAYEYVPPPEFTGASFTPDRGPVGARVTLLGTHFAGATSVFFDGVSAAFTVISDVTIEATVPAGATTGPITVVTPAGSVTSVQAFLVLPRFRRGDANGDGLLVLSDAIATLTFLFAGGAPPGCMAASDANDSGLIDISDAVFTLGFLFLGAAAPPPPFPECGTDGTEDGLTCKDSGPCAGL